MKLTLRDKDGTVTVSNDKPDGTIEDWVFLFKGASVSHTFGEDTVKDVFVGDV